MIEIYPWEFVIFVLRLRNSSENVKSMEEEGDLQNRRMFIGKKYLISFCSFNDFTCHLINLYYSRFGAGQ